MQAAAASRIFGVKRTTDNFSSCRPQTREMHHATSIDPSCRNIYRHQFVSWPSVFVLILPLQYLKHAVHALKDHDRHVVVDPLHSRMLIKTIFGSFLTATMLSCFNYYDTITNQNVTANDKKTISLLHHVARSANETTIRDNPT